MLIKCLKGLEDILRCNFIKLFPSYFINHIPQELSSNRSTLSVFFLFIYLPPIYLFPYFFIFFFFLSAHQGNIALKVVDLWNLSRNVKNKKKIIGYFRSWEYNFFNFFFMSEQLGFERSQMTWVYNISNLTVSSFCFCFFDAHIWSLLHLCV